MTALLGTVFLMFTSYWIQVYSTTINESSSELANPCYEGLNGVPPKSVISKI